MSKYCTRHAQVLDARRFLDMFSGGQSKTMVNCRGMRLNTDIGVWERRWAVMRLWCAGKVNPSEPFEMPFVCYVVKDAYVRRLYEFFRKYRKRSTEEEGFDWVSLCRTEAPFDEFYLVRNAEDWWR